MEEDPFYILESYGNANVNDNMLVLQAKQKDSDPVQDSSSNQAMATHVI